MNNGLDHWEQVWSSKQFDQVSWHQDDVGT